MDTQKSSVDGVTNPLIWKKMRLNLVPFGTDPFPGGYNALSKLPGITGRAACWAHVRRKFVEASKVLPKSLLGKAVHYALGLWPQLIVYPKDGHIPIDNNPAENAIRPFVIGRKNWLFSGSPQGARASAMLYSLIETAKANSLEPKAYLNYLFAHLPAAKTEQAVIKLLPQNLQMSDLVG